MAKIDFAELKKIDICAMPEWLDMDGAWTEDNAQWRGRCPACNKSARDIVITREKGSFYCHALKRGGTDAVSLVAHCKKISQVEAGRELTKHFLHVQEMVETQEAPPNEDASRSDISLNATPAHADPPSVSRDLAIVAQPMNAVQLRKLADLLDEKKYERVNFI